MPSTKLVFFVAGHRPFPCQPPSKISTVVRNVAHIFDDLESLRLYKPPLRSVLASCLHNNQKLSQPSYGPYFGDDGYNRDIDDNETPLRNPIS